MATLEIKVIDPLTNRFYEFGQANFDCPEPHCKHQWTGRADRLLSMIKAFGKHYREEHDEEARVDSRRRVGH